MRAHLSRIAEVNPKVNAIVALADGAMEEAIIPKASEVGSRLYKNRTQTPVTAPLLPRKPRASLPIPHMGNLQHRIRPSLRV
jgi:hypothetical protein